MIKEVLKDWIPPALLRILRPRRRIVRFGGTYDSWQQASAAASGYDSPEILRRVAESTRRVVRGEAPYERDSVVFDHIEYAWPLLAALMQVAAESGTLRVIDVGGSLGSTFRQNQAFLRRLGTRVTWKVVEQQDFVSLGKREFTSDNLQFHATVVEAARGGADVVLFASSLCYLERPEDFLREVESLDIPFMIVDRLPVLAGSNDRIALQEVSEPIYPASYPVRLFSETNLLGHLLAKWELVESWDCDLQPDADLGSHSRGYFLARR